MKLYSSPTAAHQVAFPSRPSLHGKSISNLADAMAMAVLVRGLSGQQLADHN